MDGQNITNHDTQEDANNDDNHLKFNLNEVQGISVIATNSFILLFINGSTTLCWALVSSSVS
jgi:hypothetical protein